MENKIDRKLAGLKSSGTHGLMAHIVVGYPDLARSERLLDTLADSGADLIELQVPFSDPLADGPTIMTANLKALEAGVRVADVFRFAEKAAGRLSGVPLLFMSYLNIPFNYGMEAFCRDSAAAGICGLIVPDIPPEETAEGYRGHCLDHGLHPVYILSPSSTEQRVRLIASLAGGFIYCTAMVGITGARDKQQAGLQDFISRVRAHTGLPLALGFGISSREHVLRAAGLAEVSVIGSKVIDLYNQGASEEDSLGRVSGFLRSLRGSAP
ncbi:MAG: tryptophan synthase subunit alpha [Candidatus Glassbacteria bacterium]|nr:tryptophan synthase subunit alpha [Candidatus Glassbacteria bacterium]